MTLWDSKSDRFEANPFCTMKLEIRPLAIPDVLLLCTERIGDARGYFAETYVRSDFVKAGIATEFVQDNEAFSARKGTLRGLHFQTPPLAQAKLVRVLRGRVFDVAVDLRRSSQTFGRHVAVELHAETGEQLLVPRGFAHGYCTLEPDTLIAYKVDNVYAAEYDRGVFWADPDLDIRWPVKEAEAVVSARDRALPRLKDTPAYFD